MRKVGVDVENPFMSKGEDDFSYFKMLDLVPLYSIDMATLEKHYIQKQRLFHPDRFVLSSEAEQLEAHHRTTCLNEAYRVLKSPYLRGQHILACMEHETGQHFEYSPTSLFLMEMMEAQEKIMSFKEESDKDKMALDLKIRRRALEEQVVTAFDVKEYQRAADYLGQIRYLDQLSKAVRDKEI